MFYYFLYTYLKNILKHFLKQILKSRTKCVLVSETGKHIFSCAKSNGFVPAVALVSPAKFGVWQHQGHLSSHLLLRVTKWALTGVPTGRTLGWHREVPVRG